MFLMLYLFVANYSKPDYSNFSNKFSDFYQQQLVSIQTSPPSTETLKRPVFITAHGFGASPFEWHDFSDYITTHTNALVSNVYLGSHHSLTEFSHASWEDWLDPICQEYQRQKQLMGSLCKGSLLRTCHRHIWNSDHTLPNDLRPYV